MSEKTNNLAIILRDTEIVVFVPSIRRCVAFPKAHKDFDYIYKYCIREDATDEGFLERFITVASEALEKYSDGAIKPDDCGVADIDGLKVPHDVLTKIKELQKEGYDWKSHENFWHRCQLNPRRESVLDLFRFISKHKLTITTDGTFIAYKAITGDFKDKHTHSIDNYPGCVVTMPREQVAFDPSVACSSGLHVANLSYAQSFACCNDIIVLVEVDPIDVVSVPYDSNAEKIRCCKYKVLKVWNPGKDAALETSVVSISADGDVNKVKVHSNHEDAVDYDDYDDEEEYTDEWSEIEDNLLLAYYDLHGDDWDAISDILVDRTPEECEERYEELKDTRDNREESKEEQEDEDEDNLSQWDDADDMILIKLYNKGNKFSVIAEVVGYSPEAVERRVHVLRLSGKLK